MQASLKRFFCCGYSMFSNECLRTLRDRVMRSNILIQFYEKKYKVIRVKTRILNALTGFSNTFFTNKLNSLATETFYCFNSFQQNRARSNETKSSKI